ncbi:MAG: hypothetical protein ACKO37_05065 [Vampirovibrionales bacterium]
MITQKPWMGCAALAVGSAAAYALKEAVWGSDTKLGNHFRVNQKLFQSPTVEHRFGDTFLRVEGGSLTSFKTATSNSPASMTFKHKATGNEATLLASNGTDTFDVGKHTLHGKGTTSTHSNNPMYNIHTTGSIRLEESRNQITLDLTGKPSSAQQYQVFPTKLGAEKIKPLG